MNLTTLRRQPACLPFSSPGEKRTCLGCGVVSCFWNVRNNQATEARACIDSGGDSRGEGLDFLQYGEAAFRVRESQPRMFGITRFHFIGLTLLLLYADAVCS